MRQIPIDLSSLGRRLSSTASQALLGYLSARPLWSTCAREGGGDGEEGANRGNATCEGFPHLVRGAGSLVSRMWQMIDRACYCPIVYNALERFKDEVRFDRR